MRRRDSGSGSGGRRKPDGGRSSGRSGARSNDSRGRKTFSRSREDRDDSKPRRPSKFSREGGDKDFSKPRGGKTFGRSKDASGFSSRGDKPYPRSRDDRDDSKPGHPSKFSREEGDKDFSKPRGGKTFGRSKDSGFSSRSDKPYSRSRDDRDDSRPRRTSNYSRPADNARDDARPPRGEKSGDKKGFFSKLSRGGKSYERRHDPDFGKSVKDFTYQKEEAKEVEPEKIRLNRYISNSGVCSRREADELIKMGLVSVNGTVITEMGYKVNRTDVVKYDGKTLRAERPVYILMNKPKGFLTTTKDPQERNTVMQIIAGAVKERVYPVGRLDRNTTGLLLLTNDGELTDKLSHPSYNVKKIYKVDLDKPLTKNDFQKILDGVQLEEGKAMVDDLAIVSEDGKTVGIEIHIGWNRVIRRIFERLEYQVVKLDRSVYAGLDKKDLSRGHWRFLTQEEIVRLKHYK
ncbi:MAG TPA: pseudouridine synthase [Cyclobacteriaceae bacterium]|nr:pseudouridine synthase [Cyclobacteriaceae bacterium]